MQTLQDLKELSECPIPMNPLDCCESNPTPTPKELRKEKKMRTDTYISAPITIESAQPEDTGREYLLSRIRSIHDDHYNKLHTDFLGYDEPKTYGEARQWIKDGKFTITVNDEWKDSADFCKYDSKFHWGLKKPDMDGFQKAIEKMKEARQAAVDIISVKTDEDIRLKALHDFAAWKLS